MFQGIDELLPEISDANAAAQPRIVFNLESALVNTGLLMSRLSEPQNEGTDANVAAEPPIVIHPNPGSNYNTRENLRFLSIDITSNHSI